MRSAIKVTVSTLGALMGLAGIEHGIGETLQGNIAPDGMMILSWPGSAFFLALSFPQQIPCPPLTQTVSQIIVRG